MMFNVKNIESIKGTIAENTDDNGRALLKTIKGAIENQTDGQSESYSDEIYVLMDCETWFSSGEGAPEESHYVIDFKTVAKNAAVGTIDFKRS